MVDATDEKDAHAVGNLHIDVHIHLCLLDSSTGRRTVGGGESMRRGEAMNPRQSSQ